MTQTNNSISERDRAINSLLSRARKARARIKWIVGILLVGLAGVTALDYAEVLGDRNAVRRSELDWMRTVRIAIPTYATNRTPEDDLRNKFSALMDQQIGPLNDFGEKPKIIAKPQFDEINQEIDKTLEQYEKAAEVLNKKEIARRTPQGTNWQALTSTLVIEIGAITFAIFFIQMAFSFVRYYAQLAELYDAQADALVAAAGNPEQAAKFLEQFSPNIEFGKSPITLIEKGFEMAKDLFVAASKKGER